MASKPYSEGKLMKWPTIAYDKLASFEIAYELDRLRYGIDLAI